MGMKKEEQLLTYFSQMQFTDILGFAAIVGSEVEKNQNFEDFIVDIVYKFDQLPRSKRRKLLKLAADVAGANKEIKKNQESQTK